MPSAENPISIVITCFAEGELLLEAIDSIRNQTVTPLEIVVVNDASTDRATIDVCQQLEHDSHIHVVWRTTNGGPSAAREDGFRAAKGDIFVPLDADDLLPPNAIALIDQAFTAAPEAGFVHGKYIRQNTSDETLVVEPGDISLQRMLSSRRFSPSSQWTLLGTAPLRRSLWESIGGCDPTFGRADLHDLEFWIRVLAAPTCHYIYIPEVVYIWRRCLGSNSRQVTPLSWYRIAQKHFEVYRQVGLEYRAYELLLLGSKWLNESEESSRYSQALIRCIRQGQFKLPTLLALLIPAPLFRVLAGIAGKRR